MRLLMQEMMRLEKMSTAIVARPIDIPLMALEVVPSVGHIPRRSTKVGFSLRMPFQRILKYFIFLLSF
jgi:hypothetical protein